MSTIIRLATEQDAGEILAIYSYYVTDTSTSFEMDVPSLDEMRQRVVNTLVKFPWLICEVQGGFAGYAYASTHRVRAAYQWAVDVSVYLNNRYHRKGIGRALYTALFALLRLQGYYNAYAGISLPNVGSVGLHEAMGFQPVGVYRSVGYKLGAWHDVGWWQLNLQPYAAEPQPPIEFQQIQGSPDCRTALESGVALLRV